MYLLVKYFIVFIILICVEAKIKIYLTDGPTQRIGQRMYKKELLTNAYQDPKELAYDSSSRNLFFMYMDDVLQNSGRAYINIMTKETGKIDGIQKNRATAVDSETSDVYFGSENGLYRFDAIEKRAFNIGLYNINIMKLIVRNNEMYLIDANTHMIYKVFSDGTLVVKVGNMKGVIEFDVDNMKNLHYFSLCGVFCVENGNEVKNRDLSNVIQFIVDGNSTLGVTVDGLFEINCFNGTASKIADMDFIPRSMIFGDYGDVFYSIGNHIYRLRPISSYRVYNLSRKQSGDMRT